MNEVVPHYRTSGASLEILYHNVVQPWHAQSSYLHEVGLVH